MLRQGPKWLRQYKKLYFFIPILRILLFVCFPPQYDFESFLRALCFNYIYVLYTVKYHIYKYIFNFFKSSPPIFSIFILVLPVPIWPHLFWYLPLFLDKHLVLLNSLSCFIWIILRQRGSEFYSACHMQNLV